MAKPVFKHTPGTYLKVIIGSTGSGAWPDIVEEVPEGHPDWELGPRELGRTETAFVFDHQRKRPEPISVCYDEAPSEWIPTDCSEEAIANAFLFAAAADMHEVCIAVVNSRSASDALKKKASAALNRARVPAYRPFSNVDYSK
jgi:hypothetical protein